MAMKLRNKVLEAKLVVEAVRPFQMNFNDAHINRSVSKRKFLNPKVLPLLQLSTQQSSSISPSNQGILDILVAKKTLKGKNTKHSRLNRRPNTESSLKNKREVNLSSAKNKDECKESELEETVSKCISANVKKELVYLGDYIVGEEIGKGAYGLVRLGQHKLTNEKVAIKTYDKTALVHPTRKRGVEREIKILAKLKHPNIIKLITTIENTASINLIFEYVSGCSLSDYLKSRSSRRIEEYQARSIFKQLLQALEFCHSLGISHRDIKLENILMDDCHNIKIIDFGFSTYILSDKKVQLFCGTQYYMAPEIVTNKESLGPPTDIWAAGVVLYVLLTGTFPFKSPQTKELYSKIQRGSYLVPPSMSNAAKDVLRNIFEIDPQKRMSAGELLKHQWVNVGTDKNLSMLGKNVVNPISSFNKTFG